MKQFHLVIISGLSGAGKSAAIKCFEDIGFYCVDNLPLQFLPEFVEFCLSQENEMNRVALGLDIRTPDFLHTFQKIHESLYKEGSLVELLFIEARDEILIRRFSESRRPHPLGRGRAVLEGILEERKRLSELRNLAYRIIDTSDLSSADLKKKITQDYLKEGKGLPLHISLISFGFKFGVPNDVDMLFDVRFLKNPYFQRDLKFQTGEEKAVQDFVYSQKESELFMEKLINMLDFLVPLYEHDGKSYLTLGIGCTGGRHRSVAIVHLLDEVLKQKGQETSSRHRDVHRPPTR